jgi:hypothetical protein
MVFTNWLREAGRVYDDRPSEGRCQARAKNKVSKESSVRKQRNNTVQDLGVVLFRCLRLLVPYCVAVLSVGIGTIGTGVGDPRKC